MGKVKIGIYCYFTRDILTKVLQKNSLSSRLPNLSVSTVCTKSIYLVEDYSKHISEKLLQKYLQRDSNKCQFSFFTLQVNGNFITGNMKIGFIKLLLITCVLADLF